MRIHYLQHVPFEDIANIGIWALGKGHQVSRTRLYLNERSPGVEDFDWLIVLGGPMNIYEDSKYPWLADEKRFIKESIVAGKIVLGICLGAQLISDVLGSKVTRNEFIEIGWFPIEKTEESSGTIFDVLPSKFIAFHWHGDKFEVPFGATRLAESFGCSNQAFEYSNRVVGLQFHLECSQESVTELIKNSQDELVEGKYIQRANDMLAISHNFKEAKCYLNKLLDAIEQSASGDIS